MKKALPSSTFTSEEHDILGGRAKILRVKASGDVRQFRMWISDEGKYIRKSLRTKDYDSAVERAEKIVFETLTDLKTGKKLFGITLGKVVAEYINWHFPFGMRRVRLLTTPPSFNPVFAPNRVPRAVFGLAEYVMPSIWLQTAKITAC